MQNSKSKIRGRKEAAMRITTVVKASVVTAALGIACLLPATVHAQAEVAPDFYPILNTETIAAQPVQGPIAKETKVDFQGKFSLPYDVNCSGKNLKAGQYLLSVKSDGRTRLVTINGIGQKVNIPVREVASNQGTSQSALLVRKSGQGHRLEAVYLEALSAMLYLEPASGRGVMERVPIR